MPDIISQDGKPALSTTSDFTFKVIPTPALGSGTPKPAEKEVAADKVEAPKEEDKETSPETPKTPENSEVKEEVKEEVVAESQKKDGIQKRFGELTSARKAAEARANASEKALQEVLEALKGLTTVQAVSAQKALETEVKADPRPERSQFDEPNKYDDALVEWSSRQATRTAMAELERKQAENRAEQTKKEAEVATRKELEQLQASWQQKVEKAIEKHPDFEEIALADDLVISAEMSHVITRADNGADIAYYLGKNKEESAAIAKLPAWQQMMELGKIATKLSATAPKAEPLPKPVKPVNASAAALPRDPNEMTMEEYAAYRAEKQKAARGR